MDKGLRGLGILGQTLLIGWLLGAKPVAPFWLLLLPRRKSQHKTHFARFVKTPQVGFKAHLILLSNVLLSLFQANLNTLKIGTGSSCETLGCSPGRLSWTWGCFCATETVKQDPKPNRFLPAYLLLTLVGQMWKMIISWAKEIKLKRHFSFNLYLCFFLKSLSE